MRKVLIIMAVIIALTATAAPTHAAVDGITKDNYTEWEKVYPDSPGYNKGEADLEYLPGEEYFYNEYIDHWNVDRVYDPALIPADWGQVKSDRALVREYCLKYYKKAPKYVKAGTVKHHKGKMIVEVVKSKSFGAWGKTSKGYKIKYNKKVKKGKVVTSYLIYSPKTNSPDAVVAVVDNKEIR